MSALESMAVFFRVAVETFEGRYNPERMKERVEVGFYRVGMILLVFSLILFPILIIDKYIVFGGFYGWVVDFVGERRYDDWFSGVVSVEFKLSEHLLEIGSASIFLFLCVKYVVSVLIAWRRHRFEETYSSKKFKDFLCDELRRRFGEELFVRYARPDSSGGLAVVPMAAIKLTEWEGNFSFQASNRHEGLAAQGVLTRILVLRHRLLKKGTVKWPNRLGYAISKVDVEGGKLAFELATCRYQEDLDTTYTLGYAYYLWYRRSISALFSLVPRRLLMPNMIKKIYPPNIEKVRGEGFFSYLGESVYEKFVRTQLGVQAMVIFNDYASGGTIDSPIWKVVLQKRSANVASAPNAFQFIPSGGFESHQSSRNGGALSGFVQGLLSRECDVKRALLREFAEEVLGVDEFMENESFDPDEVFREPSINAFESLCLSQSDRTGLVPMGISASLVGFKCELSFALIIDSPDFFVKYRLRRSDGEAKVIFTWPVDKLKDLLLSTEHPLVDASVCMLKLFVDDECLHKRLGVSIKDQMNGIFQN